MPLADTEEIYHVEIQIVQHFHFGWVLVEQNLGAAREGFDVCRVLGQHRDDFLRKAILAADIW